MNRIPLGLMGHWAAMSKIHEQHGHVRAPIAVFFGGPYHGNCATVTLDQDEVRIPVFEGAVHVSETVVPVSSMHPCARYVRLPALGEPQMFEFKEVVRD